MNKQMFPSGGNNEVGIERLFFEVAIGAVGAVGAVARSRGLAAAPTRTSAGLYNWALSEGVNAIVGWNIQVLKAVPTGAAVGTLAIMKVRTPGGASPLFTWQVVDSAGAATDPASGDSIVGWIDVKNSSA
jgi:hypothetical protein